MPPADVSVQVAQSFGVSGSMKPRRGLFPEVPLTMIHRRNVTPDDSIKTAAGISGGIALGTQSINVFEGQWVTLNASGNAIIATEALTATGLAYPVFSGGDRLDPDGGLTVLWGKWICTTSFFDKLGVYAVGTPLKVGSGTVNINGVDTVVQGCLTPATLPADAAKVVALVEQGPFAVNSDTPDGVLRIISTR